MWYFIIKTFFKLELFVYCSTHTNTDCGNDGYQCNEVKLPWTSGKAAKRTIRSWRRSFFFKRKAISETAICTQHQSQGGKRPKQWAESSRQDNPAIWWKKSTVFHCKETEQWSAVQWSSLHDLWIPLTVDLHPEKRHSMLLPYVIGSHTALTTIT